MSSSASNNIMKQILSVLDIVFYSEEIFNTSKKVVNRVDLKKKKKFVYDMKSPERNEILKTKCNKLHHRK